MRHVLVVDDNPYQKEILEIAAQNSGVRVTVLHTGTEAIEFLSNDAHDVDGVLIDLAMSPMDGITLTENLRQMEKSAPIHKQLKLAFYTGQAIDGVITRAAQELGVRAEPFTKPCDPFELISSVKDWLEH